MFDFELSEDDMERIGALDYHQRLANGDTEFTTEGQDWQELWDDEVDARDGEARRRAAEIAE